MMGGTHTHLKLIFIQYIALYYKHVICKSVAYWHILCKHIYDAIKHVMNVITSFD